MRFGTSKRDKFSGNAYDTPGPGNYNINSRPATASTFGRAHRGTGKGKRDNPGPGSYNIHGPKDGPRFSMASKYDKRRGDEVPGPGAYGRQGNRKGTGTGPRFGTERRDKTFKSDNPGPGNYESGTTLSGPKFGFGS
jgi:hypothetical protein